jgi:hypothetical protein
MISDTPLYFIELYCKVILAVISHAVFTALTVVVDFTFSLTWLWQAVRKFQNYHSGTAAFISEWLHRMPHNAVQNMLLIEKPICRAVRKPA